MNGVNDAAERAPGSRRTVFVTGAAGFIGSAVCRRLLADGQQVIGYDNLSRGRRDHLPPEVHVVEGDIRDRGRLHRAISDAAPDTLIHLAAMHFVPECIAHPEQTVAVNVEGTRRVLEASLNGRVGTVVFASSGAVYAPSDGPCVEDTTPLRPLEIYGESKLAGERLVAAFGHDTGIATIALRLFNAVGRRETNPHVIPHIFESLKASDTIPLGNLEPRRDYIDARDVADAMVALLDAAPPLTGPQVFNVGTGVAHSVRDVVESLRRILGRRIVVTEDASRARATDRMLLLADIGRIQRLVGWSPRIGFEDALRDLALAYDLQIEPHLAD